MLGVRDDALTVVPFSRIIGKRREFPSNLVKLADVLAR